jgi:hypothetical protein
MNLARGRQKHSRQSYPRYARDKAWEDIGSSLTQKEKERFNKINEETQRILNGR